MFFYQNDINPDGCLSKDELEKSIEKLIKESGNTLKGEECGKWNQWDKVFTSMDMDGDCRADFHEFYTAAVDHKIILSDSNLETIFSTLNPSKKEFIDKEDFKKILPTNLNKKGKVRRPRTEHSLRQMRALVLQRKSKSRRKELIIDGKKLFNLKTSHLKISKKKSKITSIIEINSDCIS